VNDDLTSEGSSPGVDIVIDNNYSPPETLYNYTRKGSIPPPPPDVDDDDDDDDDDITIKQF